MALHVLQCASDEVDLSTSVSGLPSVRRFVCNMSGGRQQVKTSVKSRSLSEQKVIAGNEILQPHVEQKVTTQKSKVQLQADSRDLNPCTPLLALHMQ